MTNRRVLMRNGRVDWKVLAIGGMAIVIVVLLSVLLGRTAPPSGQPPGTGNRSTAATGGEDEPSTKASPPPDVITVRKREENTYRTSIVGQVKGEALNKDWGFGVVTHYLYRWELVYDSEILKNDGRTLEEERRFLTARTYLVVSPRRIDVGTEWLFAIEGVGRLFGAPGGGAMVKALEAELNSFFGRQAEVQDVKGRWDIHSIEGKTALLTLPDTMKSSDVQVSGDLNRQDRDFLRNVSLLLDARTLPKEDMEEGETWTIPASELAMALDPALDGKVVGTLRLARLENERGTEGVVAPLLMNLDATLRDRDAGNAVQGRFYADGQGRFNKQKGVLETAKLSGTASYEQASTDHFLWEARHEYKPELTVEYRCYNLNDPELTNIRGRTLDMEYFKR